MSYDQYYQYYENNGYLFDRELLTTYCLSLYTKPFVILSGISGTGKTKIAQLFSAPATQALNATVVAAPTYVAPPGNFITMTVGDGILSRDGRANLRYQDIGALLSPAEIAAIEPEITRLKLAGRDDNICPPFSIIIEGVNGEEIKVQAYLQRASSPLFRLRFKSKRGEPFYDSTEYFKAHHQSGDILKLEKIADKRLKIVSVNNAQVISHSHALEKKETALIKNTCFVSVRSDWTDSSALFGYYNLIDQKYHVTPLVTFMLKAKENPDIPFFVILDEMNLAKVEHYFSDFLSCLESRHFIGGKLHQEKIQLQAGAGEMDTTDDYFDVIPNELEIPKNLFVTGTVNIDESTYMFSPKVLDRANVIELNDVDLDSYESGSAVGSSTNFQLEKFPQFTTFALPSKQDFTQLPNAAKEFLKQVHKILSEYHLHFGYRVINEISRYILNAIEHCSDPLDIEKVLDYQLSQKILPKFNGSQNKLDLPIRYLLKFLVKDTQPIADFNFDTIQDLDCDAVAYPLSASKLKRMYVNLSINGFANFIE